MNIHTPHHTLPCLAGLALLMALPDSTQAATLFNATRVSIDAIVGQGDSQATSNPPATGYYIGAAGANNTTVGVTGGNPNRYGQDLVYRYTLPTLNVGETVESFAFSFTITSFRNHSNSDTDGNATEFGLDVYLLDTDDPTTTGDSLFLRSSSDPGTNALVGAMDSLPDGGSDSNITLDPPLVVTYTIDSGASLALLQSFYDGHTPLQDEASFRFNLDTLYEGAMSSRSLNRYIISNDSETSGFSITAIPEPTTALLGGLGMLALLRRRR